jgi:hypothetical protein
VWVCVCIVEMMGRHCLLVVLSIWLVVLMASICFLCRTVDGFVGVVPYQGRHHNPMMRPMPRLPSKGMCRFAKAKQDTTNTKTPEKRKPPKDNEGEAVARPGKLSKPGGSASTLVADVELSHAEPPKISYLSSILEPFRSLRKSGKVYVDKTAQLYDLVLTNKRSNYLFVARPPQFGKTLMCSMLANLFQGEEAKPLFEGLWINNKHDDDPWNYKINRAPIIYIDMGKFCGANVSANEFRIRLVDEMAAIGKEHNISVPKMLSIESEYHLEDPVPRPIELMEALAILLTQLPPKYDNKNSVLIFDNYDAPLTALAGKPQELFDMEALLRQFYAGFRNYESYYRLVYVTGTSRFSRNASLFKSLRTLLDVSFKLQAGTMFGFTTSEVEKFYFSKTKKEIQNQLTDEAVSSLQNKYGGYRFGVDRNNGTLSESVMSPVCVDDELSKSEPPGTLTKYLFASSILGCPVDTSLAVASDHSSSSGSGKLSTTLSKLIDSDEPLLQSLHNVMYDGGYVTMQSVDVHPKNTKLTAVHLGVPNLSVEKTLRDMKSE